MPLQAPDLDTRTFEDLFREARLRIPRYAPEWTDFNESDPGITLLQLYAWLTESILYQLNRVPERNYVKFLQLLGLEREPARPAVAQLTFTAQPGARVEPVPAGAQVAAQAPEGGPPLIFETDEGFTPIAQPLTEVLVFDGTGLRDVTAASAADGTAFAPLGWVPQVGSALYLGFAAEPPPFERPFPRELRLRVFLPVASAQGRAERCGAEPPGPPVELVWEFKPGPQVQRWRPLDLFADGSAGFTREGDVLLEGPVGIEPALVGPVEEPRYWLRCRLAAGGYPGGRGPEIDLLRPNTVSARNLATVRDEVLGESEGLPGQLFSSARRPLVAGSLSLWVEGDDLEAEEWMEVADFLASGPDEPHYTLNANSGEVRFGDGERGRIPPAGAEIVARRYRYGGGAAGNVAAGAISAPLTPLPGVERVENVRPAVGGRDEQSVEELKLFAPRALRSQRRAVGAQDFATLAQASGGVDRATALALAHPDHPGVEVPGAVTVVVLPDNGGVPPRPSPELLRHVCNALEPHRLLTTEVYVREPDYLAVGVEVRLAVRPDAAFDAVAREVAAALDGYLDPRRWAFGEDLYPTGLYDVILDVPGVVAVESLALAVDGRPHEPLTRSVRVPPGGLVYGVDHRIVVEPAEDR